MIVRIPYDKIEELVEKITHLLAVRKTTLKELQSLLGSLNFVCRAICPGRPFMRRLITATSNVTRPHHSIRINKGMKADLHTWLKFFDSFNGVSVFSDKLWVSNVDLQLFTDSSGKVGNGFGIYFNGKWAYSV